MEEVKEKKTRKKAIPCAYGVKDPTNINGLNQKYMITFLRENLKEGKITKEQVADFKERKKEMKKDSGTRKLFATMFMPHLIKEEELSFDDALDKLLKD